jgi:crotonobetainyl-CoA:carnitine CoA-transferase CaiB-like acyl-CoA transferase
MRNRLSAMLALENIRVIDFTLEVAGPYCSMLLGDMGADVIKVERPGTGDHARSFGPYGDAQYSVYFFQFNRNKRSLTLDLKKQEASEIFMKLVRTADVLVENYSPGVAERLRVDYRRISEVNPRLVYCSISGFGKQTTLARPRAGYAFIAAAEAGILSSIDPKTLKETEPLKPLEAYVDYGAGMYAAFSIVTALLAREKTDRGQYIDVSLVDTALSWRQEMSMYDSNAMEIYRGIGPDRPFRTKDTWIYIEIVTDEQWKGLCEVLGTTQLLDDPRYATAGSRLKPENYSKYIEVVEKALLKRSGRELLEKLIEADVPCGKVNTLDEIFQDKSLQNMIVKLTHPLAGKEIRVPGIPFTLSETPGKIRFVAPMLGEHTQSILKELGYDNNQIGELRRRGVI